MSLTNLLILINVLAFVGEFLTGSFTGSPNGTLERDALLGSAVLQDGSWWRIVTGAFLHVNLLHIGVNMIALFQVGTIVEMLFGRVRYALLYVLAMLGSGLLVVFATPDLPTVGASGAIFGLFGALLAAGLRLGPRGRLLIRNVIPVIVLNLVITFTVPSISWAAHVGGLVTGFVAGFLLFMLPSRARSNAYAYAFEPTADAGRVQTIEQAPHEPPA
ncbi:MAG TPA: rhomboid family intramembrane serine protease [Candidatus Sulfotelmatobacter sp.]|nr:rhomboid family intramembrane serine protease [Candidatus Sulfotelmatobacter sp.]